MSIPRLSSPVTYLLIAGMISWMLLSGIDIFQPSVKEVMDAGANFAPLSLGNEFWRNFSALFVHYGFLHLLLNSMALLMLGRIIEPQTGSFFFLLLYLLSGLLGNAVSMHWNIFTVSMGASGAIFGLFGFDLLLTLQNLRKDRTEFVRALLTGIIYVSLILFIGEILPFDNAAHIGGLVGGLLMGLGYLFWSTKSMWRIILPMFLLVSILFLLIPDFQQIHYNQYSGWKQVEDNHQEAAEKYVSDAEAMEGYKIMLQKYDSLHVVFSDSLEYAPMSLKDDRQSIARYLAGKKIETGHKIRLLQSQSYRYLDSIEYYQPSFPQLNYPLSFGDGSPPPDIAEPNVVKVLYNEDWKETEDILDAAYYRLGIIDSLDQWNGPAQDYYLEGGIQMKGSYIENLRDGVFRYYSKDSTYTACGRYADELRVGRWEFFHENGLIAEVRTFGDKNYLIDAWGKNGEQQVVNGNGTVTDYYTNGEIKSKTTYREGLIEGRVFGNYGDGTRKFEEVYEGGVLIRGRSFAENSTNSYDRSIYYPYPKGGMEAFEAYIKEETSKTSLGKGEVRLLFTCPPSGELFNIRVWKGYSPEHDRVAIDLLENGPKWNPAMEHGMSPYVSEGTITITFN